MFRSGYTSTFSVLSAFTSGIALFNLARTWSKDSLNGAFVDLVAFYQHLFFPLITFLRAHASWVVPPWDNNVLMLVIAMVALNARSLGRHFESRFESEATTGEFAGRGSVVAQVRIGLTVAYAHLLGAESIGMSGARITPLTTSTITATSFALFICLLAIPYVRAIAAGGMVFSAVALAFSVLSRGRLTLVKEGKEGVQWLNKTMFAMHYLGAIIGAVVFYLLNRSAG